MTNGAPTTRIGFLGLGNMGGAMAANLVAAGYPVRGTDLDPARMAALAAIGGTAAPARADLVPWADVVFLSVPGPLETEEILLGEGGLLAGMRPGTAVISASTITADLMLRIAEIARPLGVDLLDAPVTGAADGARAGTLTFMIGADPEAFDRWRHVIEPLASVVMHTGPVGTGSAAKLLTNLLWFTHVVALGDSLALARKAGITMETMRDLIPVSAGDSWVASHDMANIFAGDDDESFTLALCCKDLRLIGDLVRGLGARTALVDDVKGRFDAAMARFGAGAGELAVVRLAEEGVGASVRIS
jgi:3-hydroxyisobutyrate dehydrogenase